MDAVSLEPSMEMLRSLRSRWHSKPEFDEPPLDSQLKVPGPIPTPPLSLMRGGLGSLRQSKPSPSNPQPSPGVETTSTIHTPPNTQFPPPWKTRRRTPRAEPEDPAAPSMVPGSQQNAHVTTPTTDGIRVPVETTTVQTSEDPAQPNSAPAHGTPVSQLTQTRSPHASLEDPALIKYCSGCFIDPMGASKCPELHSRYQKNLGLIRKFLVNLQMQDPRVAVDFAMVSKAKSKNSAVATILFTCLNENQKKHIESGLHKHKGNVIPPGFVPQIVVWETVLSSQLASTPSNPGLYDGMLVEASIVEDSGTLCGVLGHLHLFDEPPFTGSFFNLGGLIIVGEQVFALTTAHSLFKRETLGLERRQLIESEIPSVSFSVFVFFLQQSGDGSAFINFPSF
jgi:hypothetical protein